MSSRPRRQPVANKSSLPASLPNSGFCSAVPLNDAYTQASLASNNPAAARGMQGTTFRQFARPPRHPDVPPPVLSSGTRGRLVERQTLVPSPTQSGSASSVNSLAQLSPTTSPRTQYAPHSHAAPNRSNSPSVRRSAQPVSPEASRAFNFAQSANSVTAHAYMRSQPPPSSSRSTLPQVRQPARAANAIPAPAHDLIDLTLSPSPSPEPESAPLTNYVIKTEPTNNFIPNGPSFASTPAQIKTEPSDAVMQGMEYTSTPELPYMAVPVPASASVITTSTQPTTAATAPASHVAPAADSSAATTNAAKRGRPSTKKQAAPTPVSTETASPAPTAKRAQPLPADVVGAALIYQDAYKRRTRREAIDQELIDTKVHNATLSGRLEVLEKLPGGPQDAVVAALTAALAESHSQVVQLHSSLDDCEGLLSVYRNACWQYGIVVDEETGDISGLASAQLPDTTDFMDPMGMMTMNAMDLGSDSALSASTSSASAYTWDMDTSDFLSN